MDLTLSPQEMAFPDELRGWLEANHPGEDQAATTPLDGMLFGSAREHRDQAADLSGLRPAVGV